MLRIGSAAAGLALAFLTFPANAADSAEKRVVINAIDAEGIGQAIGALTLTDTPSGLRIMPDLSGLSPGIHGMHVHEKADCRPAKKDGVKTAGLKAGGHFDPAKTGAHKGPFGQGHLGDLPYLTFDAAGKARIGVVAPRIKLADVVGHAIIIHEGADNYADEPQPLGGGGARVACGVVE